MQKLLSAFHQWQRLIASTKFSLGPTFTLLLWMDGCTVTIAAADAGYPVGKLPVDYTDELNGQAYGVTAATVAGQR